MLTSYPKISDLAKNEFFGSPPLGEKGSYDFTTVSIS